MKPTEIEIGKCYKHTIIGPTWPQAIEGKYIWYQNLLGTMCLGLSEYYAEDVEGPITQVEVPNA